MNDEMKPGDDVRALREAILAGEIEFPTEAS